MQDSRTVKDFQLSAIFWAVIFAFPFPFFFFGHQLLDNPYLQSGPSQMPEGRHCSRRSSKVFLFSLLENLLL